MVREYLTQGMPGTTGAYCVEDCQRWADKHVKRQHQRHRQPNTPADADEPLLAGPATPALEAFRSERAQLARLDRLERERELLPREIVHAAFARVANLLRNAGEQLERRFGPDAREILDDALTSAAAELGSLCADNRDHTDDA